MKLPGPDHPITIAKNEKRVRVSFAGRVVADTTRAHTSRSELQARLYIPRADADMSLLAEHPSHALSLQR